MEVQGTELKLCPTCKGAGKVVTGYGVICTEVVEKVVKCPTCKGEEFLIAK
jgi:DnaJ-class molecular chaperone